MNSSHWHASLTQFLGLSIQKDQKMIEVAMLSVPVCSRRKKVAAITECWERLMTRKKTPTATAITLTLHRMTGSVEATKLYHHAGFGCSYTDVRCLTNTWAKSISLSHKKMLPGGFMKKRSIHVTFDNSDGKQQTITGDHTTHHTTGTIFQARYAGEDTDADMNQMQEEVEKNIEEPDFGNYTIPKKKRKSPKPFPGFTDRYYNSKLLDDSLYRDIAWVLVGYLGKGFLQEVENQCQLMK